MSEDNALPKDMLIWVAVLSSGVMETSRHHLLPRTRSEFMILGRLGSVVVSMTPVATEGTAYV